MTVNAEIHGECVKTEHQNPNKRFELTRLLTQSALQRRGTESKEPEEGNNSYKIGSKHPLQLCFKNSCGYLL